MNKRILLPLKEGDKVVRCAKATSTSGRGDVGQVATVIDNLTVQVKWEYVGGMPVHLAAYSAYATERAYSVQKESGCHHCVHRMRHLAGQECPRSWKEVKSIHESVEQKLDENQSSRIGSESTEASSEAGSQSGGQPSLLPESSN